MSTGSTVLSIQSHVAMGHVGNSASTPVWQALGVDVWGVSTVLYSSHPGWPNWQGHTTDTAHLEALLDGLFYRWDARPAQAIVSGFFGSAEQVEPVAHFIRRVRDAHGPVPFICDPVLGDHGKFYVDRQIKDAMVEHLFPLASTLLPNQSELGWLTDQRIKTLSQARVAADELASQHQCEVVTTGVREDDVLYVVHTAPHQIPTQVQTPYHPFYFAGCGDVFGALFTYAQLSEWSPERTLAFCAQTLDALLEFSIDAQQQSLALIPWLQQWRGAPAVF